MAPLLNKELLLKQKLLFMETMVEQAASILNKRETLVAMSKAAWAKPPSQRTSAECNLPKPADVDGPATLLWQALSQSCVLVDRLSEFFKVAELALVIVQGSVEDERVFSALAWLKDTKRNRLSAEHLTTCVRMVAQKWYSLEDFPYTKAIEAWKKEKKRRGL